MTQDEIIEMARQAGFDVKEWGDETLVRTVHSKGYFVVINQKLEAFAKLVEEKSIQPYLPYKEKIEAMERAYDAHFKKARGQA